MDIKMIKISVLLYLNTASKEKITTCVENIIHTSGLSGEELQLILLDPYRQAPWDEILKNKYPDYPTVYPNVQNTEEGAAYNVGIQLAEGEYLSFFLATSSLSQNAFANLVHLSNQEHVRSNTEAPATPETEKNLLTLNPEYVLSDGRGRNYAKIFPETGVYHAEDNPIQVQLILSAYLVHRNFLGDLRFNEKLHKDEVFLEMLLRLLSKNRGHALFAADQTYYYARPQWDQLSLTDLPEKKWWYTESLQNFLLNFMYQMKKEYDAHGQAVPVYLSSIIYYILCVKFKVNLSGNDKLMMNEKEVLFFYDLTWELLTMIDNDILYHHGKIYKMKLPRALRIVFLKGKAQKMGLELRTEIRTVNSDGTVDTDPDDDSYEDPLTESSIAHSITQVPRVVGCFVAPDSSEPQDIVILGDLNNEVLNIQVINERDGYLELDGFFQGAAFLETGSFKVYGKIEGSKQQIIPAVQTEVYALLKCFGVSYSKKYAVHMDLPVKAMLQPGARFGVYVLFDQKEYLLKFKFSSVSSRLLTYSQKAYWRFGHGQYLLSRKGNFLHIEKATPWKHFKKELLLNAVLLIQKNRIEALTCTAMRLWYWLTKPFYKSKRIWVTFDKLYKGGDNGEYFFRYCQTQKDDIDCYYVINKNAPDKQRLTAQYKDRILFANTWKCRMMVLRAEAIMATHAGTPTFMGFKSSYLKYFKDLYQADNICIQHGLSIQKIANFQNRLYANTKLYCLASPFELANVAKPIYGYQPEMLKLTGLARYDGLKSCEQKQILITPTWRKNVVQTKGVGMVNDHNNYFKETSYFKIYNSLINDKRLIAHAKKLGYRIIFLLHPAMSSQLDDYDRNDYVELVQATGDMSYEKILTESSLMVTDYSGVQFDFAYQRKPIVYYHPAALPPHYTEGGLIYDTMGFGPICTEHEQLIDCLCSYMDQNCQMSEKYKERADQFFAFDDFHNAERIYSEVLCFENAKKTFNYNCLT